MKQNDRVQRSKRQQVIIRAVESGRRSVSELIELTGASGVTIRRDLEELHELGALERVRGGAQRQIRRGAEYPFAIRRDIRSEAKAGIAALAAAQIEDGMSVYFDVGTTVLAVATLLRERKITAITPSLHCAAVLTPLIDGEVIVPEGPINQDDLSISGAGVREMVQRSRFDVAILGACAADPEHGLTVADWNDARNKAAVIAASQRRIMPAIAEKFSAVATHRFGALRDLSMIVTDESVGPDVLARLREDVDQVLVAGSAEERPAGRLTDAG